jgi:hypothetical protein
MELPIHGRKKGVCDHLKKWKPLEGWTLGMVQTYFALLVFLFVMFFGIWHCRAYRMVTELACGKEDCHILRQEPGAEMPELDERIMRSTLTAMVATRLDHGEIKETKGLKRRELQKLDYSVAMRYRKTSGAPQFPHRTCVGWRQTGGCDGQTGERETAFDKGCTEEVEDGHSGYCECSSGGEHDAEEKVSPVTCDHEPFNCQDRCLGINHELVDVLLARFDLGRQGQRRAVDKVQRYINEDLPEVELNFSTSWTWLGMIVTLLSIIIMILICCLGEMTTDWHEHQW